VLLDEGYAVMTAKDERAALALLPDSEPSLIFLDVRTPAAEGFSFIDCYRKRYPNQAPVIVFTTCPQVEKVAKQLGADGYLAKPFDLDELILAVTSHMSHS
jgi:DNA-binding response OmpR family regulator